jgi:hypothetical protein
MNKIEYKSVKVTVPIETRKLNWSYASEGWELVTVLTLADGFEYIFKRSETSFTIQINNPDMTKEITEQIGKEFKKAYRSRI